ncbi:MAG: hypothetical protein IT180_06075 [Acidobacteria bacterium]|nr:hypothetical protein [Acidobacteriota bacterium]
MTRPNPPDLAALGFGAELDEAFRGAHPNPTRQGCPSHDVLVALSRRERPIEDPAYEHLLDCSPCYVEVRDMQRAHLMAMHDRPARRWWIAAAAAAALIVALGAWWFETGRSATPGTAGTPAVMQVTLDLRPYSVTRSPTAPDAPPPLELPRGVVELTLLLPVGSEPGPYDVQVLDAGRRSLAVAQGEATIREFVTTVQIGFDLRSIPPANYELAVRRVGDSWRIYAATLR